MTRSHTSWLDELMWHESEKNDVCSVYCPFYDRLIQYGLTHGWIDPDTGLLYTDETDPQMKEAA